ncbi:Glu-tRNA(Gln) amidotransferase subunit GatE [Candidatus Bathyarchaeota archaeon]|nr:Glu-tRNA(Gln) amidotransferase subunit GatE [Candidatus Bathyarchaeota archaeon]MBS7627389.1 Glu-tRNA(Gln) amidotransferase subunit GatE [Candidatus Bathyarchaeota archaeon]
MDYESLGLKVGLELHQQLKTASKLFCLCKPELREGEAELKLLRKLRPTQSELGQVDPAALFEFKKGRKILYEAEDRTSCLVELDEEPPHPLNQEALDICLTIALMIGCKPVDEIHVMRKIVIDGSNTTGFQRTCIVALGGLVEISGKQIPIQTICLEEDAARLLGIEGSLVHYSLDRLGIPLVEVATAPVLSSPKEAEAVALALGRILRATGKVRRGLGTIRQDVNISISQGALIEVKGVQKLELVSKVVEYEVQRQLGLLAIRDELKARGVKWEDLTDNFIDVTEAFRNTACEIIRSSINNGGIVLAVRLRGFKGLLGKELIPNIRFGTELADVAKFWGRVKGLFHTDELPGYGISSQEVTELKKRLNASEYDAIVFVADRRENASDALMAVVERARQALVGVPEETRGPNPDGTTRYLRPRPGAARMYPETDIPPIVIDEERIARLRADLPELPELKVERFIKDYRLSRKLAEQIVDSDFVSLFEEIVSKTHVAPSIIAVTLTETLKTLSREGLDVEALPDEQIMETFFLIDKGELAKEAIPDVLRWLLRSKGSKVRQAMEALGLRMMSRNEVEAFIDRLLMERKELLAGDKSKAFQRLLGIAMSTLRGKVDAAIVQEILRKRIQAEAGGPP